ncbi:MAG: type II toxin-antitoxin system RelE/ParE family toxin [Clostridiales bacterium]|nr:type II toxin-antitoxin system RelE/ParE family toxin [Clostridiales bacterium]
MMHIVFSPESLKDLEQIKDYLLDRFGEKTAGNNLKKVIKEIKTLESFPLKGSGIWERYGIDSEYRYIYANNNYVFYRVDGDEIKVIRVLDARRDFLNILFGIKTQSDN